MRSGIAHQTVQGRCGLMWSAVLPITTKNLEFGEVIEDQQFRGDEPSISRRPCTTGLDLDILTLACPPTRVTTSLIVKEMISDYLTVVASGDMTVVERALLGRSPGLAVCGWLIVSRYGVTNAVSRLWPMEPMMCCTCTPSSTRGGFA